MFLSKKGVLVAPFSFWCMTQEQIDDVCNGCGPQGGIFNRFLSFCVPDSLFGLNIKPACNIHDYCWSLDDMTKKESDNLFLDNMGAIIDSHGGVLRAARHWAAFHYWIAVRAWRRKKDRMIKK